MSDSSETEDKKDAGEGKSPAPPPPPPNGIVKPKATAGGGPRRDHAPQPPSGFRMILTWLLAFALISLAWNFFSGGKAKAVELESLDEFEQLVEDGFIEKCELVRKDGGQTFVRGVRKVVGGDDQPFTVNVMPDTGDLQAFLRKYGVPVKVVYPNPYISDLLIQILPIALFFIILYWLFYRNVKNANSGPLSFGKSRARLLNGGDKPKITFGNVAGVEGAKEDVKEIIEFLKAPQKFSKLGGRIPKGVLLMGPPGTGKTLLAKAIAGEAGVPFFSISGSDFVEMFVGVGASRVRDMFEQGKKNAPCIIFIDEIDAVGRSRFTGIGGGHDEREQTLNAMLVEMDGFETSDGVIVIAATNRPDVLDKALLRPGRFDRQIVIDLPTMEGRLSILKIHAEKLKVSPKANLEKVARGTPGFSGADLANLLNEAALHAAAHGKDEIEQDDLEEARDKVWWGRERPDRMRDADEKLLTAFHEAGHAVVMLNVKGGEPLHKVTIIPRGMSLGATMFLPKKDQVQFTRTQMLAHLATDMGGRVAEELFLDDISSGASQDIKQATELARKMVCDWGMSPTLGPRSFGNREETMFLGREVARNQDYSEATAQEIDREVTRLVKEAYETARDILKRNEANLRLLVDALLDKETIDGEDAEDIVKYGRVRTEDERNGTAVASEVEVPEN